VHTDPSIHPFDSLALDTFGPLPTSVLDNRYILVAQCLFSRYVILVPLPNQTEEAVAKALVSAVFSEHGIPRVILSDNGPPYSSTLLEILALKLGIHHKFAPAYHPQSNGLVERFMSTLRNMIVSFTDMPPRIHLGMNILVLSNWRTTRLRTRKLGSLPSSWFTDERLVFRRPPTTLLQQFLRTFIVTGC
jgi:transposase InsO family protein